MDSVIASLNRIEGQVRGVKKMYEDSRDCTMIAQQVSAIQSALKKVAQQILESEACKCSTDVASQEKIKHIMSSLIKLN